MKRLFVLTLLGLFACGVVIAQPKNYDKNLWKTAKKIAKGLTAEGWKITGSYLLEEAIYLHRQKIEENRQENQELTGEVVGATNVKTLNQAQQWAANNAALFYGKAAKSHLQGRATGKVAAGVEGDASLDNFLDTYERLVSVEIGGQLRKSYILYREKREGGIDCRIVYIVNEAEASQARLRAMERARKEAEFAIEDAERISEFVKEGFKVESE